MEFEPLTFELMIGCCDRMTGWTTAARQSKRRELLEMRTGILKGGRVLRRQTLVRCR